MEKERMRAQLAEKLSEATAADGLPRNRGEYRILEIDTTPVEAPDGETPVSFRPKDWEYAFWGPWVSGAEPVRKCRTKEEVLAFFTDYEITAIDDGMGYIHFPPLEVFDPEGKPEVHHTITDTITVDVAGGRCFVIRDWDRSRRAHILFEIHTNRDPLMREMREEARQSGVPPSWRLREYMVI